MLGASEYANVKTNKDIKVGQEREPVAEYTTFRWVIIAALPSNKTRGLG